MPAEVSAAVVAAVDVPVIGCGAGPACCGHVVVTPDALGLNPGRVPRFVPRLADVRPALVGAYAEFVRQGEHRGLPRGRARVPHAGRGTGPVRPAVQVAAGGQKQGTA